MKGLSLIQPWATLIALGAKTFETRSWRTNYKGHLAIHASKRIPPDCRALCYTKAFREVLIPAGFGRDAVAANGTRGTAVNVNALPVGAIVAVVDLTGCWSTEMLVERFHLAEGEALKRWLQEQAFGDYRSGRFGFRLENVRPVDPPVESSGCMGLWNVSKQLEETVWERITATV